MSDFNVIYEEFKVQGKDLVEKIKALVHEGNIRRIIVKNTTGHTFVEIPLTVAAVGVILAPILAAVGALAAVVADFNIVVEKREAGTKESQPKTEASSDSQDKKSDSTQ